MRINALLLIFLISCGPLKPLPDHPEDYVNPSGCSEACANLERLACPGWKGSPGKDEQFGTNDDIPCEEVCRDVVKVSLSTTLHQRCTAEAQSCTDVEHCFE